MFLALHLPFPLRLLPTLYFFLFFAAFPIMNYVGDHLRLFNSHKVPWSIFVVLPAIGIGLFVLILAVLVSGYVPGTRGRRRMVLAAFNRFFRILGGLLVHFFLVFKLFYAL